MKDKITNTAEMRDLNRALGRAQQWADWAAESTPDCGRRNFDSVAVCLSICQRLAKHLRVKLSRMLIKDWGRQWEGCFMVELALRGEGTRRTAMARAACKALREYGYDARVYYKDNDN